MTRWTKERAHAWWAEHDWVCGFNYLPSSAVNFLEMWRRETFDPETISRELRWAAETGFNAARTNLHYLVWLNDRDSFMERVAWFLDTAWSLGISTMPVLFDDCGFGGFEPEFGPQPEPIPQLHNSRAVACPGRALSLDRANWTSFKSYVTDVISTLCDHPAVLVWDLYNEPGNGSVFTADGEHVQYPIELYDNSRELMVASFEWARAVSPPQPLTVAAWRVPPGNEPGATYDVPMDREAIALSDVVSFHAYCTRDKMDALIRHLEPEGRPLLCTEWMARTIGSRISDQLELLHATKTGCYTWGLVQGRTQTHRPWPHMIDASSGEDPASAEWFHDVFHPDGRPYDVAETELVLRMRKSGPA